jgi:hypothetical protein
MITYKQTKRNIMSKITPTYEKITLRALRNIENRVSVFMRTVKFRHLNRSELEISLFPYTEYMSGKPVVQPRFEVCTSRTEVRYLTGR